MNHPQKTHKLYTGQKIGEFILRQKIPYNGKLSPNLRLRWRVECSCGTMLTLPEYYMLRDHSPKRHCGCKNKTIRTHNKQEYTIWMMMHIRCESPKHEAFKHYGGRGIKVCERWHRTRGIEGFAAFLEDMGKRPSPKHSLDRIDNDGIYEPGNVRWATSDVQRANQRTPERVRADLAKQGIHK